MLDGPDSVMHSFILFYLYQEHNLLVHGIFVYMFRYREHIISS